MLGIGPEASFLQGRCFPTNPPLDPRFLHQGLTARSMSLPWHVSYGLSENRSHVLTLDNNSNTIFLKQLHWGSSTLIDKKTSSRNETVQLIPRIFQFLVFSPLTLTTGGFIHDGAKKKDVSETSWGCQFTSMEYQSICQEVIAWVGQTRQLRKESGSHEATETGRGEPWWWCSCKSSQRYWQKQGRSWWIWLFA